ncbi:chromate efflux transporter [Xanthocytophaga flava]|uniref:chromate efflux transporter n=1 Tax=Xanthocytophaga flava TaxID=3048013 RepID=UPI0028D5EBD3|nr:chromate efflux transporter [Xanthocytophaga flavus]MDJ1467785.1 chromate efflux transporter [Xanthocytophaga flavus]
MPKLSTPISYPSFHEAFLFWLKLGFISFGGPVGQIAIMHNFVVTHKKWISEGRFLHALNYCMVLPGPEAQQLATYIGWLLHGTRGGLAAGILFVLPSVFFLLGLSLLYVVYGTIPWVYALFYGLKPAVIAIIVVALVKIAHKSLVGPLYYAIAICSFICIFFLTISFPYLILTAILIAWICQRWFPYLLKSYQDEIHLDKEEDQYLINQNTTSTVTSFRVKHFLSQTLTGIFLWGLPIIILYYTSEDFPFYWQIAVFFTKAALITFGGAYAVLPYIAQITVEQFHWLSSNQMIDGLALGETTPGPLIMVLSFVGFLAGYNHSDGSLLTATNGLVLTTYYTFLPCFLFILIGAPLVEKTRQNPKVKSMLALVTAAVVGVILNLTLTFSQSVIFPEGFKISVINWFALGWAILSFVVLSKKLLGMISWIGISALAGLVLYLSGLIE